MLVSLDWCGARVFVDAYFIRYLRRLLYLAWYFPAIGMLSPVKFGSFSLAVKFLLWNISPCCAFFGCIGFALSGMFGYWSSPETAYALFAVLFGMIGLDHGFYWARSVHVSLGELDSLVPFSLAL